MRIASGGFTHETNSFSSLPITQKLIDETMIDGAKFLREHTGVHNTFGGIIATCAEKNIQLVPTIFFHPCPSAPTEKKAFEDYRDRLVRLLWEAHCQQSLDGIMLDMHGAGVAEGYEDLEAELLRAVREKFGPDMPIAVSLDLHGNISPEMHKCADIMVGFKCYPHVDGYETTVTAVRLLHEMVQNRKPFGKALVTLPWHIPSVQGCTIDGPARKVQQYLYELIETDPDLLDASFFHGFPYTDTPQACASVVTVARTQAAAERCANALAGFAWNLRHEFNQPANSAQAAMDLAENAPYPVVIHESSDNPGGGSPGDGTHLLREMLKRDLPGSAFAHIYDPEVAELACRAGVGSRINCLLGAKNDNLHGTPIALENAYVKAISDGIFQNRNPMEGGQTRNIGPLVLLVCSNVQIVVSSDRHQTMDNSPFRLVGIDWSEQRILALKSTHHFKGWWFDKAKTIIPCDSPGIHSADFASLPFRNINFHYFPFEDAVWEAK